MYTPIKERRMLYQLVVLGSIPFIILTTIIVGILVALLENEQSWWSTFTIIAFAAFVQLFSDFNLITFVKSINFTYLILSVIGYFIMGAVWAIVRWSLFCVDKLEKHKESMSQFLHHNSITVYNPANNDHKFAWDRWRSYNTDVILSKPPQVRDNKAIITMWMSYWPINAIWVICNDPVRRVFRYIYYSLMDQLQSISNKIFANTKFDMNMK